MLAFVFSDSQRTGHVAYLALLSKHHATGYALRLVHSMRHAHELLALLASCPAHLTALSEDVELAPYSARPCRDRKLPRGFTGRRPFFARTDFASLLVVGGVSPFGDPGRMVQNLPHKKSSFWSRCCSPLSLRIVPAQGAEDVPKPCVPFIYPTCSPTSSTPASAATLLQILHATVYASTSCAFATSLCSPQALLA